MGKDCRKEQWSSLSHPKRLSTRKVHPSTARRKDAPLEGGQVLTKGQRAACGYNPAGDKGSNVNCSSCGRELGATDVACPNCGQAVPPATASSTSGGPPPGRPGGGRRPVTPMGSFKFDRAQWSSTDRVAGVATLVLFISLFLPWYGVSVDRISITANATAHRYMFIPLILCIAELAYLV